MCLVLEYLMNYSSTSLPSMIHACVLNVTKANDHECCTLVLSALKGKERMFTKSQCLKFIGSNKHSSLPKTSIGKQQ